MKTYALLILAAAALLLSDTLAKKAHAQETGCETVGNGRIESQSLLSVLIVCYVSQDGEVNIRFNRIRNQTRWGVNRLGRLARRNSLMSGMIESNCTITALGTDLRWSVVCDDLEGQSRGSTTIQLEADGVTETGAIVEGDLIRIN